MLMLNIDTVQQSIRFSVEGEEVLYRFFFLNYSFCVKNIVKHF